LRLISKFLAHQNAYSFLPVIKSGLNDLRKTIGEVTDVADRFVMRGSRVSSASQFMVVSFITMNANCLTADM